MGIYDRPYIHDEQRPSTPFYGPQTVVGKLILINVVLYVATYLFGITSILEWTSACDLYAVDPKMWYTFLTYGFAHAQSIGHIFCNMFALYMFGREIEGIYGPRRFLALYLTSMILGGAGWTFSTYAVGRAGPEYMVGASGAVAAVVILYCFHFPKRTLLLMFVLPIPAWLVGVIFVGMDALGAFGATHNTSIAYQVHLIGAACGALYYRFGQTIDRLIPQPKSVRMPRLRKPNPNVRLHRPSADVGGLEEDADRVLEKLHREGEESLTPKERLVLESYSRKVREQRDR